MPTIKKPHAGSLQFWPRTRAKRVKIRSWSNNKAAKLLGFAGYKAGMAHAVVKDNIPNSLTKGQEVIFPITIVECPPLKTLSLRFYKKNKIVSEVLNEKLDKEVDRKIIKAKKIKSKEPQDFDDIRLNVYSQPKLTGIGKKKPEIFEIAISGTKEEKLKLAKEFLTKDITINDVFKEGSQIDIHAITKGKGFQGPVKRFGISIRRHKSEKTKRGPGSLGPWISQAHIMWRVPHAGQMGYHLRTEYNKWLLKIGDKGEEVTPKAGFIRYGIIKNPYIIIKGSIIGPKKRFIRLNEAIRPNKKIPKDVPQISDIVEK